MTLKITAVLLSSVLASASYASDVVEAAFERSSPEVVTTQHVVPQKAVPDSFEGAGEYRTRRATLESRLKSFEGQKLKVFTPEIFAEMLSEAVEIANLGFHIWGRLPALKTQINEQLSKLGTKIASKNARVPWRELVNLVHELSMYNKRYWNEFEFDMKKALSDAQLQPQVLSAHEKALTHSEGWKNIESKWNNVEAVSMHEYCMGIENCNEKLTQLIQDKFDEERDESITKSYETFQKALSARGMALVYDLSLPRYELDHPRFKIEKWMNAKVQNKALGVFENGIFSTHGFVFTRELLHPFVVDPSTLSTWGILNEYCTSINSIQFVEEKEVRDDSINLKPDVKMQDVYEELKAKVERSIHAALEETFEWLMTQ